MKKIRPVTIKLEPHDEITIIVRRKSRVTITPIKKKGNQDGE